MPALTLEIARRAVEIRHDRLPEDIRLLARQCLLDWFAVTLAGAGEELSLILRGEAAAQGGHPVATLIGAGTKAPTAAGGARQWRRLPCARL